MATGTTVELNRPLPWCVVVALLLLMPVSTTGVMQPQDTSVPFTRTIRSTIPTDLAVTDKGWLYLVGVTRRPDFETTANAFDRTCGTDGRCNPFVGRFGTIETLGDVTLTVFDPNGVIHYSTYIGGAGEDGAAKIAIARDGSVWLSGPTSSITLENQPAGVTCGGSSSIWLGRFDIALQTLQDFRCLLSNASILDLVVDADGDAWLTGTTGSGGVPMVNPWQATPGGQIDSYVLEFARGQSAARSGTYIGGNALDAPSALAIAPNGAVVVTGNTVSMNFPVVRPFQPAWAGPFPWNDAFVVSLDPSGRLANFSTVLGGNGNDTATAVAVDAQGNIFVALNAASDDLPTSADAYDRRCGSGSACSLVTADVYVAKFSSTGSMLAATYLGGAATDYPRHVSVLSEGSILVGGSTQSADFPIVPTAQFEPRSTETGFLAFFDANLRTLQQTVLITDATYRPTTQQIAHARDYTYVAGQISLENLPSTYLRKFFRVRQ